MKRKCIYILSMSNGIVDQYVWNALHHFQSAFDNLLLVCSALPENLEICLRPNDDLMMFSETETNKMNYSGLLAQIGWNELAQWDEIIITDDCLMGPVFPLKDMLSRMEERTELGFWGLTACNYATIEGKNQLYIPLRFIAFRKELLKDSLFRNAWEKIQYWKGNKNAREEREYTLTKLITDAGYRWDTYVRIPEDRYDISDFLLLDPMRAVKEEGSPMFLKSTFICSQMKYITISAGEQPWEFFRYLRQETDYEVPMIWRTLIRTEYQDDIARALRMTYVLPSGNCLGKERSTQRVALVMHLYYMDLLEEALHYASSMPEDADLYIFTCNHEKAKIISKRFQVLGNHKEIHVTQNRGRDVGSFLVETANLQGKYDLICFYHDKKSGHLKPHMSGNSFAYKTAECVLCSKQYVLNVIHLFETTPYLGMISGSTPNHGSLLGQLGREWGTNYNRTKKLAEELEINVPMAEDHRPAIGLGDVFWYRTKAMVPMFRKKWKYEDFPEEPIGVDGTILHAIERIYPFAVQEAGYLPGRALPDHLAALEISNLEFYVREYNRVRMDAEINGDIQTVIRVMRERLRDRKSTRLNSSHRCTSRMPSSA